MQTVSEKCKSEAQSITGVSPTHVLVQHMC